MTRKFLFKEYSQSPTTISHRRSLRVFGVAAFLLFSAVVSAFAVGGDYYVSPRGSNSYGTGSRSQPFATVGHAISIAGSGDTVTLEPGTYKTSVSIKKAITFRSDPSKANAVARTVIDASGQQNGIVVMGAESAGARVIGLTVKDAFKAGILVMKTNNVTVSQNVVTKNDQSCAGFKGCFNPHSSLPAPNGTFTFTNSIPCGSPNFKGNPGQDCEALHLLAVRDSKVTKNTVVGNLDGGIYLTDEAGPTSGNTVSGNLVDNNGVDCGITLASHNPKAVSNPESGGVYRNMVKDNVAVGNGAAGVMIAGPIPGIAVYKNTVTGNYVANNGMPGIALHGHTPHQDLNGNVLTNNTVVGNGAGIGDPDAGLSPKMTAGILVLSPDGQVKGMVIRGNSVADEHFGMWLSTTAKQSQLSNNRTLGARVSRAIKWVSPASLQ